MTNKLKQKHFDSADILARSTFAQAMPWMSPSPALSGQRGELYHYPNAKHPVGWVKPFKPHRAEGLVPFNPEEGVKKAVDTVITSAVDLFDLTVSGELAAPSDSLHTFKDIKTLKVSGIADFWALLKDMQGEASGFEFVATKPMAKKLAPYSEPTPNTHTQQIAGVPIRSGNFFGSQPFWGILGDFKNNTLASIEVDTPVPVCGTVINSECDGSCLQAANYRKRYHHLPATPVEYVYRVPIWITSSIVEAKSNFVKVVVGGE